MDWSSETIHSSEDRINIQSVQWDSNVTEVVLKGLYQGCTTQIICGPKIFFRQSWGPKLIYLYEKFAFMYCKTYDIQSLLGSAGQISSLCGPHLARGPYVVHAWSKIRFDFRLVTTFCCLTKILLISNVVKSDTKIIILLRLPRFSLLYKTTTLRTQN